MIRFAAFLVLSAMLASFPSLARTMEKYDTAVLRLLDKGTARVEQIEIQVGAIQHFRQITVEVRSCQQTPPEEEPESAALLTISESVPQQPDKILFSGWMFASNPSLNALEHPLYDVWVISCKNPKAAPSNAEEQPTPTPAPPVKSETPAPGNSH